MKTSRYIQTGLVIFILATTFIMFATTKQHFKNLKKDKLYNKHKIIVDDFSVIVVGNKSKVNIHLGATNALFVQSKTHKPDAFDIVKVINDTLYFSKKDLEVSFSITGKSIKKIIGKRDSKIHLFSSKIQDSLNLDLYRSTLTSNIGYKSIEFIKIKAQNHSKVDFYPIAYKELVEDENGITQVKYKYKDFKDVNVILKNHSILKMRKPKHLVIETDSTSRYSLL